MRPSNRTVALALGVAAASAVACVSRPRSDWSAPAVRRGAVEALARAAELRRRGDPDRALAALEGARGECLAARDERCAALVATGIGEHQAWTGNPGAASTTCADARERLRGERDRWGEALAMSCLAAAELERGAYSAAAKSAERAAKLARAVDDEPLVLRASSRRVEALRLGGDRRRALAAVRALVKRVDRRGGAASGDQAEVIRQAALTAPPERRKLREVEEILERVAPEFRKGGDLLGEARTLDARGVVAREGGQRPKALELHRKAMELFRAVAHRNGEADALVHEGDVHAAVARHDRALASYEAALAIRRTTDHLRGQAEILARIGNAHRLRGDSRAALLAHEEALALCRRTSSPHCEATTLRDMGLVEEGRSELAKALERFDEARAGLEKHGSKEEVACLLSHMAVVKHRLDEKGAARGLLADALSLAPDPEEEEEAPLAPGEEEPGLLDKISEWALKALLKAAYEVFRIAVLGADPWAEASERGAIRACIGRAHLAMRQPADALPHFQEAVEQHRHGQARVREAEAISGIAAANLAQGDRAAAREQFEAAREILHAQGAREQEAAALAGLASTYPERSENRRSRYWEVAAMYRDLDDDAGRAGAVVEVAAVEAALDEHDDALSLLKQAADTYEKARLGSGAAGVHRRMAGIHAGRGELQLAFEHFDRALAFYEATASSGEQADTEIEVALALRDLGEDAKALEHFERALPLVQRTAGLEKEGRTRIHIAETLLALGKLEAVAEVVDPLYDYFRGRGGEDEARVLVLMSRVFHRRGLVDRATDALGRASVLFRDGARRRDAARALTSKATLLVDAGDLAGTIAAVDASIPLHLIAGDRAGEAIALTVLARAVRRNPARAIFHAKQAVNLYQSLRADIRGLDRDVQRTYAARIASTYRLLAELLAERGRLGEAELVLALLKDEELYEFARRDAAAVRSARVPYRAHEEAAARRYEGLANELAVHARGTHDGGGPAAEATATLVSFLRGLDGHFAAMAGDPVDPELASSLAGVLPDVGPRTVAILVIPGEQTLRTVLVTSTGRTTFAPDPPVPASELGKLVLDFRNAMRDGSADPVPPAQELYRALLGPMEQALERAAPDTIVWVLDGPLRYAPVNALHDGKGWLVDRYRSVIWSGGDVSLLTRKPAPSWTAVALGTTREYPPFSRLPGVEVELLAVIRDEKDGSHGVLPGRRVFDFGRDALVDSSQRREPVVHVASHFAFEPGNETQSFLLLGDGNRLTLGELRGLKSVFAGVDLLTLSACDTAMSGGEGAELDGFARIAQDQGATAVIASLWPVPDPSTPALMHRFYSLRERGDDRTKAAALQRAQQEMAHGKLSSKDLAAVVGDEKTRAIDVVGTKRPTRWTHPRHWAPFVLIGNGT
jgi:CHAT domain-containing protein/tetratricopeptide (TPR) repeat protein